MPPIKAHLPGTSGKENHAYEAEHHPNQPSTYSGPMAKAADNLVSAVGYLRCCAECLTSRIDAAETPTLVSQARLHNVKKLIEAVKLITSVMERLAKSERALGASKTERSFLPMLINTLAKESSQVEKISRLMSTNDEDASQLDLQLREIRTAVLRCIDAFEPIHQAVFRPKRRSSNESDRVGNQVRECLRSLDIHWRGIHQAKEALPIESKICTPVTNSDRSGYEQYELETIRYWPV